MLKDFDRVARAVLCLPTIIIASPSGVQFLNSKRKKTIDRCTIVMSEIKSLDYILQLPRLIEDVGRKKRLQTQNERLQRMIEKKMPGLQSFSGNTPLQMAVPPREDVRHILVSEEKSHGAQNGLKVKIKTWAKLRTSLGLAGRTEILDLLSRIIHSSVRNSDRILKTDEDEFLVFLANTPSGQITRCRERLEKAFKEIRLEANDKLLKLGLSVRPLPQVHS